MNNTDSELNIDITCDKFILSNPRDAVSVITKFTPTESANFIYSCSNESLKILWPLLPIPFVESIAEYLSEKSLVELSKYLDPIDSSKILNAVDNHVRNRVLKQLDTNLKNEIHDLLNYPNNSAGTFMSSNFHSINYNSEVKDIITLLRATRKKNIRIMYVIDDSEKLIGYIDPYSLLSAHESEKIKSICIPINAVVTDFDTRDEIIELMQSTKNHYFPVVNSNEQLVGVIDTNTLITDVKEEISAGLQTMVGASKDERALSSSWFAVKKRLPWLEINLLTAFLAAAVIGIFESLIAKYTVLAIFLPVIAGQSGNAGAQALAVTMRGLALKEISTRKWLVVALKEIRVGFINGIAISITCMLGVYLWSWNTGLTIISGISMVIAMTVACLSGAIIPVMLKKLKLDPASASSIILTTVTDVSGFFAFLGIATVLAKVFVLPSVI